MEGTRRRSPLRSLASGLGVLLGAAFLTLVFFLALPIIQAIGEQDLSATELTRIDTGEIPPPPPPPPEDEPEPEPEPEPEELELNEEVAPLDLDQLEVALGGGLGSGIFGSDMGVDLGRILEGDDAAASKGLMRGVEQPPRVTYRAPLSIGPALRAKGGGQVRLRFLVDEAGKVVDPQVESSTDKAFEGPALDAIRKWRFDAGRRDGESVPWHISQSIRFPDTR